jgi:uncharacterized protein YjbI with pentapeptide repeats
VANEEHLARLKQGVNTWDRWRAANSEITPDLAGAILARTNFSREDLAGVDLSGADLTAACLIEADLTVANLSRAMLAGADLRGADFSGADLAGANLSGATLIATTLNGADLDSAVFCKAYLIEALLRGANLSQADFSRAHLTMADFTEAALSGANFHEAIIGWTILGAVDVTAARGLETVQHQGPSTIGIDTLYRSHGNIPEVFLRGAGAPENFITCMKSLLARPSEYYSCFISYSSHDEALAQRLHTDLQDKGVRCWFAPEDLQIGDEFRSVIDASIHRYDRLLLILSEYSVQSRWVQKEVETAFEKEGKEHRVVLFPVRIDEAVMQSAVGWAADIRRQRHISDFRQWEDREAYQKAFNRLLRDLKADI